MSYDLYFYKRKENQLTEDQFAGYLTSQPFLTGEAQGNQWIYEHEETGVYFSIERNEPQSDDEIVHFDDFTDLNFSFNINFFRPRFFGLEAFAIIDKMIADQDLYVVDPQDQDDADTPQKFPAGYLKDQWTRHNDQLSKERFDEYGLKYLDPVKSDYLWRFQSIRKELQDSLDEDIFVAGIFVLQSKGDNQLHTVCVWPQHIPIILPKVDYVIIKKKYRKFFKDREESGLIAYDELMLQLKNPFTDFKHDVPNLKKLGVDRAPAISSMFNTLKLSYIDDIKEFGPMIRTDNFVNSRP